MLEEIRRLPIFRHSSPYQIRGYSWLAFLRRWVWAPAWPTTWDWKNIQALALILAIGVRTKEAGAPDLSYIVVNNWQKEARVHPGPAV